MLVLVLVLVLVSVLGLEGCVYDSCMKILWTTLLDQIMMAVSHEVARRGMRVLV